MNVRHILIKAVDEDGDGNYNEEELAKAREALEAVQEQWDGTEEDFIRLAEEYSEDTGSNTNGGLYENIHKGQTVEEFDAFCFDGHAPGDTAIVYGSSTGSNAYAGYHLIYFVGESENYRHVLADSALRSSDFYAWEQELKDSDYPITRKFAFRYV